MAEDSAGVFTERVRWAGGSHRDFVCQPLVVDARGNAVTFTRSGQLVILTAEGPLHTLKGRACARPLAVLPAGERRVITACADGNVASWSQP